MDLLFYAFGGVFIAFGTAMLAAHLYLNHLDRRMWGRPRRPGNVAPRRASGAPNAGRHRAFPDEQDRERRP